MSSCQVVAAMRAPLMQFFKNSCAVVNFASRMFCRRALASSLVCAILATAAAPAHADPKNSLRLDTQEGHRIFARAATPQSLALLVNFETQATIANCGLASAVMVLNTLTLEAPVANFPRAYNYFTQQNFFSSKVEDIVAAKDVARRGITLEELAAAVTAWGPRAEAHRLELGDLATWRALTVAAIEGGDFVICNYDRAKLLQKGRGHHSPVAAYDPETDRFLLLDVARYAYPALWVDATTLFLAIAEPSDSGQGRGMVIVRQPWQENLVLARQN